MIYPEASRKRFRSPQSFFIPDDSSSHFCRYQPAFNLFGVIAVITLASCFGAGHGLSLLPTQASALSFLLENYLLLECLLGFPLFPTGTRLIRIPQSHALISFTMMPPTIFLCLSIYKSILFQLPCYPWPQIKQRSAGRDSGEAFFLDKKRHMQLVSTSTFLLLLALKAEIITRTSPLKLLT